MIPNFNIEFYQLQRQAIEGNSVQGGNWTHDLVAESIEQRWSNLKLVGSIPILVRVFLCPSFLANCTLGRDIIEQRDEIWTDITLEFEGLSEAEDLDQIKTNHTQPSQEESITCDSESFEDEVQCENVGFAEQCYLEEDCDYRDIDFDEGFFGC